MKIAYIIVAHKYPEQLARLIHQLNTEDVSFFIHIDKKVEPKIYHQVLTQLNDFPNVYFLKRFHSGWGSFDAVKATLEGMKSIVKTGISFDYVIHLSGQDYPIKSNAQIKTFLEQNKGKEFIEYFPLPCSKWKGGGLRRIDYWHIRWKDEYICIPEKRKFKSPINSLLYSFLILFLPKKRKFLEGFALYGGSAFWCLTGECVKYIDDFVKQNPKLINSFNYTFIADELFYQIVILNSPFKDKIINNHLRYIDWGNFNALHPRILEKKDFEKIRESEKLFARKFDLTIDPDILDMIDQILQVDV
ncbi:beta-1,6-N-acetylglucosaminyltransferase [Desmonostoc muscorum LEGE 12446]|uniref:Peptide O-xylosyltransferase n=1 Tax=Desmonostoc muscorum LEGE 12446 TaxID=1828758 RepID=A0A8J7DGI8_DESMC|nr:beta-1,6-N-acetylglucosaminyltransferase [Desmonostoc muscorum]MCF2149621.1 beta-1,6-N-acetylglucosaminyltransferase [Desmonostoc muscorum LEGE 12446]